MPLGRARPQSPQLEKVIGKEFDRRRPITSPTFFSNDAARPDATKNQRRVIFVRQADGTFRGQYSDGAAWQTLLATSVSFATPTFTYGTTATAGSATTTVRSDARLKFPQALMSTANSSTLTLTDDATDQTLTGSLGALNIRTTDDTLSLPAWTGGAKQIGQVGLILAFTAGDASLPAGLQEGIRGSINLNSNLAYGAIGYSGARFDVAVSNIAGATFTGTITRALELGGINSSVSLGSTSTFARRSLLEFIPRLWGGTNVTTTDTGIINTTAAWPIAGVTAGAWTNAFWAKAGFPTVGGTIRRGVWITTVTGNIGTESANSEGFYCEDITRGTAQRANFYAEGATNSTPTDVYAFFQGTAHVVGTNRYGARFTGATTGTPTLSVGVQVDGHSVGTTKWAFYGDGDASHFAGIDMKDATNIVLQTTTGTKIGTGTTQKLGFWNAAPVVQPATAGTVLGYTANVTANLVYDASTFTGNTGATAYTIGDIVNNLKTCGILKA